MVMSGKFARRSCWAALGSRSSNEKPLASTGAAFWGAQCGSEVRRFGSEVMVND